MTQLLSLPWSGFLSSPPGSQGETNQLGALSIEDRRRQTAKFIMGSKKYQEKLILAFEKEDSARKLSRCLQFGEVTQLNSHLLRGIAESLASSALQLPAKST